MVERITKKEKLRLVKNASTFKLIIPQEVEAKIRHLCNRVHDVEWSGTLFYKVEGSLDEGSLIATCMDIFVMDIGTGGYTEYSEAPDVISYMCEHPELLEEGVFEGLVHSHNHMATFFSGTDTDTLIEEGTNANHFLSLIVNNAGKYTAGITRKIVDDIKAKVHITYTKNTYYDSFGNNRVILADNTVSETDKEESKVIEYIEWFEADIDKAEVSNDFEDIDARLSEIRDNKAKQIRASKVHNSYNSYIPSSYNWNRPDTINDKVAESRTIATPIKNDIKDSEDKEPRQLNLFGDTYDNAYDNAYDGAYNSTHDGVEGLSLCMVEHFDEDLINTLAAQLLTGSIIINTNSIDIEQWVKTMDNTYERRFGPLGFDDKDDYEATCNLDRLEAWIESMIEFLIYTRDEDLLRRLNGENNDPNNKFDESDTAEVCAYDLYWVLNALPESKVKDLMMEKLETYLPHDIFKY